MNPHTTRVSREHSEYIWNELNKLNWTQEEIRRRTGLDRAVISRFVRSKRASLATGARLALAITVGRLGL